MPLIALLDLPMSVPSGASAWHREHVPDDDRPAWRATARTLVLYNPKSQWRYAIYNDEGIVDGALPDVSAEAQTLLLRQVEEMTGQRYAAAWKQDKPHWWSADLTPTP